MQRMKSTFRLTLFIAALLSSVLLSAQNHSFSYATPLCKNGINPAPITSTNFVSGGNFISSAGLIINTNSGIINLGASTAGTYTVTYTGAFCLCFTNAPVSTTITISPSPTITIAGNSTVCAGSAITLTASGATTYTWSSGSLTSTMTDFPFATATTYTALGTATTGCTNSASKTVTLIPTPTVSIAGNSSVCVGYNYTMAAQTTGAASYTWSGTVPITANTAIITTTLNSSATFSVLVSVGGCTSMASIGVAVVPIPTITVLGSNTLCAGDRTTLYAQGAATYSWNTGATADSIGVQPVVATSYTAYGTDLNGCTSSKGFTVTVLPKPTVSIIGGSTLCSGKTLALTGSGAISYTWTTGIVALGINVIANSDTTIRVTGANQQGCSNTASIHITVNPSPTLSVLSTTACAGQAATLIAEPVASQADALSYLWVPGSASGATYNPVAPFTTNYTVTATLGPCFTRAAATVSVLPSTFPQVAFSYSSPLCGGSAPALPMLSTNFTSGGTFYSTSGINVDPASGLIDLSNAPEGMANVQYSVAPKGCRLQGFTSAFVQIIKQTKINIDPTYYGIAPGESVKLTNSGGASSYEWSPAQGLSCTFCQVPTATPAKTQVYCLGSSEACVVGGCVMVEVICDRTGDFSVPTAFTPNKDGINDKYCLKGWGECNTGFNIKIFDRWGEMVFESNDPNFCWDGEFNGNLLPTATYVYFINADFERVPGYRQSGNISLIR